MLRVHVEALIAEVAEGSNINFGVQWMSKDTGFMQFANGTQIPIGSLSMAVSQAKPQKGSTVISENGATTINPDTEGDLSRLSQLLSGFSGTAVGVVKVTGPRWSRQLKTTPVPMCSPCRVSPRWTTRKPSSWWGRMFRA